MRLVVHSHVHVGTSRILKSKASLSHSNLARQGRGLRTLKQMATQRGQRISTREPRERQKKKRGAASEKPLRKSMRDLHSFVPLARRWAGHGLPRGSRSLGLPPPNGWLSTPWVRRVRRCSLAALHKAARSRVAS